MFKKNPVKKFLTVKNSRTKIFNAEKFPADTY